MTTTTDMRLDDQHLMSAALRDYLRAVSAELGIGLESCTIDLDMPRSAYIALDWRLDRFPDRDLALLWDERHGWSVAIETHSSEDLIVLSYLGGDTVAPSPRTVARFVAAIRAGDHSAGRPDPPAIREAGIGLVVHLDTVHLNITAQPGAGNLLGNLLCAVAGLLDGGGLLTGLSDLLNQILAILRGL